MNHPYNSDKEIKGLFRVYDRLFKEYEANGNLLEIGVYQGGALEYFRDTGRFNKVVGIDIKPMPALEGIDFHVIDQGNQGHLRELSESAGGFDVVIDDGCHVPDKVMASFEALWPSTRKMYVVEDWDVLYLESSLREAWGRFLMAIIQGKESLGYRALEISFKTLDGQGGQCAYLAVIR